MAAPGMEGAQGRSPLAADTPSIPARSRPADIPAGRPMLILRQYEAHHNQHRPHAPCTRPRR